MSDMQGKVVKQVRPMTDEEMEQWGWHTGGLHGPPPVVEFEDGTILYPLQDPEGNGPGDLCMEDTEGHTFGFAFE